MEEKLKLAFDPTTAWNTLLFRDLMRDFVLDQSEVEVYIITTNPDQAYIDDVANDLKTANGGVKGSYIVADDDAVIAKLSELGINIYLASSNDLIVMINSAIINVDKGVTVGITVNPSIQDRFKIQPMYVTNIQFWIKQLSRE